MKFFPIFLVAADSISNFTKPNIFDFSDPEDVNEKTKSLISPSILTKSWKFRYFETKYLLSLSREVKK